MGNTYPNHKGNYYYRNHTLYHIGTLDPLGTGAPGMDGQIDKQTDRWGFPKIRGTVLGVPIVRILLYWGLYRGPLNLGTLNPKP